MIKYYSLKSLQKAMNLGLSLDSTRKQQIKKLQGKVIEIIVLPLDVKFYMLFNNSEIELHDKFRGVVDTVIKSNPIGLIKLSILPASKVRSLFNDKIRISGDIELGQEVKRLFEEIDVDWEGFLAKFTGDVVAHQVGSFVKGAVDFQEKVKTSIKENISEYLHDEVQFFPCKEEVEDFAKDVEELAFAADRLEARIKLFIEKDENN